MSQPASEVYEIVVEETARSTRRGGRGGVVGSLLGRFTSDDDNDAHEEPDLSPIGGIIRVFERSSGREVFHHIEDISAGEGHLMIGIQKDLASMTAAEFKVRWAD